MFNSGHLLIRLLVLGVISRPIICGDGILALVRGALFNSLALLDLLFHLLALLLLAVQVRFVEHQGKFGSRGHLKRLRGRIVVEFGGALVVRPP